MHKVKKGLYVCRGHNICLQNKNNKGTCPHSKPHKWVDLDGDAYVGCYTGKEKQCCDCIRTTKLQIMLDKL